jgi:hypothetical protein
LILGTLADFKAVRPAAAVNIPEHLRQMATPLQSQSGADPNAAAAAQVEPETLNFIYFLDPKDASLVPLERVTAQMSASTNSVTGAVKGQMIVQGEKSPVRLSTNQKVNFEFRLADPSQKFGARFERFEVKDGKRILKFVKDPKPSNSPDRPGLLDFNSINFGTSSVKLSVPYDLPPGEYGITISGRGIGIKVFCFGVDPL